MYIEPIFILCLIYTSSFTMHNTNDIWISNTSSWDHKLKYYAEERYFWLRPLTSGSPIGADEFTNGFPLKVHENQWGTVKAVPDLNVSSLGDRICSVRFVQGSLMITIQISKRKEISNDIHLSHGMEMNCNKINCSAGGRKKDSNLATMALGKHCANSKTCK